MEIRHLRYTIINIFYFRQQKKKFLFSNLKKLLYRKIKFRFNLQNGYAYCEINFVFLRSLIKYSDRNLITYIKIISQSLKYYSKMNKIYGIS